MKRIFLVFLFALTAAACAYADYGNNISLGQMAYENGDLSAALKYYQAAYAEKPGAKLGATIDGLKKEIGQMPVTEISQSDAKAGGDNPWKWVLVGADIVSTGVAVYTCIDYNNSLQKMHGSIYDDSWFGNYTDMYLKSMYMYIAVPVASAFLIYTFADAFWLHYLFKNNVETTFVPGRNELKLTYNYKF
jgi:hypothetical protein